MQRIPFGRLRLGLTPCRSVERFVRQAWPDVPGPVDLRVRLDEDDARLRIHVEGPPPPLLKGTARAAAWYSWPSGLRRELAWETRGTTLVLSAGPQEVARLWRRTLHLDRRHFSPEAALDTAFAMVMAAQPDRIFLHGALLDAGAETVALTGVSGAGKTTLGSDLAAAGWRLGSDEIFGVDPDARDAWPAPRAPIARVGGRLPFTEAPPGERKRVTRPVQPWTAPRPLGAVLVLEAFGPEARVRPLGAPSAALFAALLDSVPIAASWGLEPARHALRVARLSRLFAGVRLGALTVGPRADTVAVVRRWMSGTGARD